MEKIHGPAALITEIMVCLLGQNSRDILGDGHNPRDVIPEILSNITNTLKQKFYTFYLLRFFSHLWNFIVAMNPAPIYNMWDSRRPPVALFTLGFGES